MPESSGAFSTFLRSINEAEREPDRARNRLIEQLFERAIDKADVLEMLMQFTEEEQGEERDIHTIMSQIRAQSSARTELLQELHQLDSALQTLESASELQALRARIHELNMLMFAERSISAGNVRALKELLFSAYKLYNHYMSTPRNLASNEAQSLREPPQSQAG